MALNELSRAIALKALVVDVAARIQRGERPDAIRAELLADDIPPEVVDHVFAVCEDARPISRKRTVLAAVLSALLLIGLPLAGAVGGVWAAVALAPHAPNPDPAPGTG